MYFDDILPFSIYSSKVLSMNSVWLCDDNSFYRCAFHPVHGGEMQQEFARFLKTDNDVMGRQSSDAEKGNKLNPTP